MREWDSETKRYTGRQIEKEVVRVVKSKDIKAFTVDEIKKYGWQVIGLK